MKRLLGILLVALSLCVQAQHAVKPAVLMQPAAATSGVSAERLNRIDGLLQEYVAQGWIPGATAIVVKDGKIIYHKAFGYSDLEKRTPLAKDAIFRIASQTKAITSVGIMMLWEAGKLLLDDPVSKYIPEFGKPKVLVNFNKSDSTYTTQPAKSEITIRQLLNHTSGIGYAGIGSPEMNAIYAKAGVISGIGAGPVLLADKMKILGGLPLAHQPGERWTYGLNTDVLGYIIEVVSGLPLDRFFQQQIFAPLGMKDTYFYLPKEKYGRLVSLHSEDKEKKLVKARRDMSPDPTFNPDFPAAPGTYFSGGAGLSATAYDYAIFMQMLLNGGTYNGVRLLAPGTVKLMTTNQIGDLSLRWGHKFGLGFELVTEKSKNYTPLSVGSFSWGGYFSSQYWIDPEQKIVGQLFINQVPNSHGEVHDKFKTMVYAALE